MNPETLEPLIEPLWLRDHLGDPGLVILDTSVRKAIGMNVPDELKALQIPESRFFDLDGKFSDPASPLPHMMPDASYFNREARALGINNDDLIVLYDNAGVYSSPRVWWMFRSLGHEKVVVLNGGLPEWVRLGLSVEKRATPPVKAGNFRGEFRAHYFQSADEVLGIHDSADHQILDARSEGRFYGREPEPRPGLRGGHIPHAKCLPFGVLLEEHRIKEKAQIKELFKEMVSEDQHLIFSCGSGLTACILALGAYQAGYRNISVYDGSWSEWGERSELPVAK